MAPVTLMLAEEPLQMLLVLRARLGELTIKKVEVVCALLVPLMASRFTEYIPGLLYSPLTLVVVAEPGLAPGKVQAYAPAPLLVLLKLIAVPEQKLPELVNATVGVGNTRLILSR